MQDKVLGFSNTGMIGATTVVGLPDEGTVEKYHMTGKTPDAVNQTGVNPTLTNASIEQTETERCSSSLSRSWRRVS